MPRTLSTTASPSPIQGGEGSTLRRTVNDTNTNGTELAMKAVRQAGLELSGGSTPDLFEALPVMLCVECSHHHPTANLYPLGWCTKGPILNLMLSG